MADATFPASCDTCGHEYQVPDSSKPYACRHCDGQVTAAEVDTAPAEVMVDTACSACGAILTEESRFCGECGAEQETEATAPVARPTRAKRSGRQAANRAKASKELTKALGMLKTLRTFFRIGVALALLGIAFFLFAIAENAASLGLLVVLLVMRVASACAMLVGARMVFFRPFSWSTVFAGLMTLNAAIVGFSTDFHMVQTGFWSVLALTFWILVPQAAKAQRLMEENPDLAAVRQMTGVIRRREATEEDYAEAHAAAAQRARKKAFTLSGGIASIVTVLAVFVISKYHRPSFDSVWVDFQMDWDAGRLEEVVSYFPDAQQPGQRERLKAVVEHRGWREGWPQQENPEMLYDEAESHLHGRQIIEAGFGKEEVLLTWQAHGQEWHLIDLEIPEPSFEGAEFSWMSAWEANDVDALGRMFEVPARATGNLRDLMDRRKWKTLPDILNTTVRGGGEYREIRIESTVGVFMIRFALMSDRWTATAIKPPRS